MISYFERSSALDAQESKLAWASLSTWLLLHVLLLLWAAGLTLTQEVVLFLQETLAFLGHHPAAMGTWWGGLKAIAAQVTFNST